jgi:hypothetical protein
MAKRKPAHFEPAALGFEKRGNPRIRDSFRPAKKRAVLAALHRLGWTGHVGYQTNTGNAFSGKGSEFFGKARDHVERQS